MSFLRRISTRQLLTLCSTVALLVVGATVIAMATAGGGPKPEPKKLPVAVHDALTAAPVSGVTARIQFTNHLIDGGSVQGSDPLLSGASGRLWASANGHLRLELQADTSSHGGVGDVQVLVDRSRATVYDSGTNAVYTAKLPSGHAAKGSRRHDQAPSVAQLQRAIGRVAKHALLSGAIPSDVGGRPAYTVKVSPKDSGGMLGGAQFAWDAVHGTPLRAALYARGDSSPVLELKVTDISFGPVSSSVFDVTPPSGAKVTNLTPRSTERGHGGNAPSSVGGLGAVRKHASFAVSAPKSLAGLRRGEVRLISSGHHSGALVTYGHGLGAIAVIETPAGGKAPAGGSTGSANGEQPGLSLPTVSINGSRGQELPTALGTALLFQRGGVQYAVAGSVSPAAAEAAARGL